MMKPEVKAESRAAWRVLHFHLDFKVVVFFLFWWIIFCGYGFWPWILILLCFEVVWLLLWYRLDTQINQWNIAHVYIFKILLSFTVLGNDFYGCILIILHYRVENWSQCCYGELGNDSRERHWTQQRKCEKEESEWLALMGPSYSFAEQNTWCSGSCSNSLKLLSKQHLWWCNCWLHIVMARIYSSERERHKFRRRCLDIQVCCESWTPRAKWGSAVQLRCPVHCISDLAQQLQFHSGSCLIHFTSTCFAVMKFQWITSTLSSVTFTTGEVALWGNRLWGL